MAVLINSCVLLLNTWHGILASFVTSEYLAGVAVGGHGILASFVTSEYLAGVAVGCWYPSQLCYF